ncbi:MAG: site-2 protease family protein, partial [Planctomycetota bacterium]
MDLLGTVFNLALIVLGFGLLIFVHELGHFLAAKWAGIRTEAFAVGMGPVMLAWRKGVGVVAGSTHRKVVEVSGRPPNELNDAELRRLGIGETEYSLRWLPIGGFVKMLGQEDLNPDAVSSDPRSYNMCPIGRRMVVVSAGVVMNIILAAILFIIAFVVGVRFEAAVVGDVTPGMPAAEAVARNAAAFGVTEPGLQPGDIVTRIDGKDAQTFADIQIASAMGREEVAVELTVRRDGVPEPLEFSMVPRKDPGSGLLSIGIAPGSSTTLVPLQDESFVAILDRIGLGPAGVRPGMRMLSVDGIDVRTHEQFGRHVEASDGAALTTRWSALDESGDTTGPTVEAVVPVLPRLQSMFYPAGTTPGAQTYEVGLLGLSPLVRIAEVLGRQNQEVFEPGDVVLRVGAVDGPRSAQFREALRAHTGGTVDMVVLRDGEPVEVEAVVNRKGMLGVAIDLALDLPLTAGPMEAVRADEPEAGDGTTVTASATAAAPLQLRGGTRIDAVGETGVAGWADLRAALRDQTAAALAAGDGATVELTVVHPTPRADRETLELRLTARDVSSLHELGWTTDLASVYFEPIYTVRSGGGNPLKAVVMGFEETHKLMMMTYLTIDRLIRGSVGVEQLRGPVGIVHLGTRIADRGLTYLIFFLAMISVNLAVINFLPLPIVDGGLFLFLVYEKLKG